MAEIELFKNNDGVDILEEIRAKQWLVNEANLSMYIDKEMLSSNGGIIEPSRLYLYDIKSKGPVIDYFIDNTSGPKEYMNKVVHGGLIELDEDDKGLMYKIKISEHIKNVIRKDSTNVRLGLVVSSDISSSMNIEVDNKDLMTFIPTSTRIKKTKTSLYNKMLSMIRCITSYYFTKTLLYLSIFFKVIPVPLTTALSGSSAINTGKSVFLESLLSSPLNIDPPPAKYIPVLYISAANSGGVWDSVSITESSILIIDLSRAFAISRNEISASFGFPVRRSLP